MEHIVTLYLNEIGRKAFNADTKEIILSSNDPITSNDVNAKFPMELVDHFETKPSFLGLQPGDNVRVVDTDGTHYLGEVRMSWDKRHVNVNILGNGKIYGTYEFNANGVQCTHSKNKLHLEFASEKEIEQMKLTLRNMPFINLMLMLAEGTGVSVDEINTTAPEWLTFDGIERIRQIVEEEIRVFDENC